MIRAIRYHRVSTLDLAESGAGLEAQRLATGSQVIARGFLDAGSYEDSLSGKNTDRPGLQLALSRLAAGDANVLVVSKLDRLSRSVIDMLGLVDKATREGWDLCILDIQLDSTTPAGRMMLTMLAAVAEFERRLIGQRTKDALAVKKSQGVVLGRRSGIDQLTQDFIARVYNEEGSYARAAKRLNEEGVPTSQGGTQWREGAVWSVLQGVRK